METSRALVPTTVWWYRFEDRVYAPAVDEFDNVVGSSITAVHLLTYQVIRITPKGVRLANNRFVLLAARKRFACPTVTDAMESFLARKRKQARIYLYRQQQALEAIDKVIHGDYHTQPPFRVGSTWMWT
jgi:hypothetical protein